MVTRTVDWLLDWLAIFVLDWLIDHRWSVIGLFQDDANHDPQWSTEQIVAAKLQYETSKGTVVITKEKLALMLKQTSTIFEILERAWRTKDCTLVDMKIEFGVDEETGKLIS